MSTLNRRAVPASSSPDNTGSSLVESMTSLPSNNRNDDAFDADLQQPLMGDAESGDPESELDDGEECEEWMRSLKRAQNYALVLAHFLAAVAMVVVFWWVYHLGGLSLQSKGNAKIIFNWHPLLMMAAFSFMTVATLSFRYQPSLTKIQAKTLHGLAWFVAMACAVLALVAVFQSHNDRTSGFVANLYSFHSWVGSLVIIMYTGQFLGGFYAFAWPSLVSTSSVSTTFKRKMLSIHRCVGPLIYYATAATILLGIQEKEGFIGCSYKVESPDTFPLNHFFEIPLICRVSHLLGIVVVAITACVAFTMHEFKATRSH